MKEYSLGLTVSAALHLCVLSLLMVPASTMHNKTVPVLEVDFSRTEDPLRRIPPLKVQGKNAKMGPRIHQTKRAAEGSAGQVPLGGGDPAAIPVKEPVGPPPAPSFAAAPTAPGETALRAVPENTGETAMQALLIPGGEKVGGRTGAADAGRSVRQGNETGHPDPAGARPSQGGSGAGTTADTGREGLEEGSENYNHIRDAVLKNVRYPDRARLLGLEGKVLLSFVVLEDGTISDIKVIDSSCHRILDESAKEAVAATRIGGKLPCRILVRLPIAYKLKAAKDGRT